MILSKNIIENIEKVYNINSNLKEVIESENYKNSNVDVRTILKMLFNYSESFIKAYEELLKIENYQKKGK